MAVQRLEASASKVDGELQQLRTSIQRLDSIPANERWTLDSQIDGRVSEVNSLIGKMSADFKAVASDERDFWTGEIQRYRDELAALNTELRQKRSAAQNQLADTRRGNDAKAHGAISALDDAIVTGQDTLATQQHIQDTLADDRVHLENIQGNVEQVSMEADTANARLGRMFCRAVVHKIIVWVVVAVLAGLFVLSLGLKLGVINPSKSKSPTPKPG
jgi:chromosome segregation ATPase